MKIYSKVWMDVISVKMSMLILTDNRSVAKAPGILSRLTDSILSGLLSTQRGAGGEGKKISHKYCKDRLKQENRQRRVFATSPSSLKLNSECNTSIERRCNKCQISRLWTVAEIWPNDLGHMQHGLAYDSCVTIDILCAGANHSNGILHLLTFCAFTVSSNHSASSISDWSIRRD
jgi:hypothetical protein